MLTWSAASNCWVKTSDTPDKLLALFVADTRSRSSPPLRFDRDPWLRRTALDAVNPLAR
jgi:hypothetical protein